MHYPLIPDINIPCSISPLCTIHPQSNTHTNTHAHIYTTTPTPMHTITPTNPTPNSLTLHQLISNNIDT